MKKIYLILFVALVSLNLPAQEFAPVGAKWHYTEKFAFSSRIDYLTITSVKDTTINDIACRKLDCDQVDSRRSGSQYVYYDDYQLFFYDKHFEAFQKLYDFNAQLGDTWSVLLKSEAGLVDTLFIKVNAVNTVEINGVSLKSLDVTYNEKWYDEDGMIYYNESSNSVITERIGDVDYLFNMPDYSGVLVDGSYSEGLRCYEDETIGLYTTGIASSCTFAYTALFDDEALASRVTMSPNPTSGVVTLVIPEGNDISVRITDLCGRVLVSENLVHDNIVDLAGFNNGLYIVEILEQGRIIGYNKIVKK